MAQAKKTATKPAEEAPNGLGKVTTAKAIKADTLVGDVRDLLLQEFRDAKQGLAWTLRSEKDQEQVIDRIDRFARTLVDAIVAKVADKGMKHAQITIGNLTLKDGAIEGKFTAPRDLQTVTDFENAGSIACLVFADPKTYSGERAPIRALPDQRRLLADDSDPGPAPSKKRKGGDDDPTFDNTDAGRPR